MSTPESSPVAKFNFDRNVKLLNANASLGFAASSTRRRDVIAALIADDVPFPPGDIDLEDVKLNASTANPIEFGRGDLKIGFSASASAFSSLGIYRTADSLIQQLGENVDDFSLDPLEFAVDKGALLSVIRWGYDVKGKASGAMALGAVGQATLTVSGNKEGLFAVVCRQDSTKSARKIVQKTADSWILPRLIDSIDQVDPDTWIISEVIGGLKIKLDAQVGFDFNWVREAKLGGLTGDIALRLQSGINAAVGFSASGRCAIVINRKSADKALRLRLFRLKTRQIDASLDATLDVTPKQTLLPDKVDDFISAVFGTHGQQILKDIHVLEAWTDPNTPLSTLLANAGIREAEKLIAHVAGVPVERLQQEFDAVHVKAVGLITKWRRLPHSVSSALLKMVEEKIDLSDVRKIATELSTIGNDRLKTLLNDQLSRIDFFHTPVGRFLESASEGGILKLLEKPIDRVNEIGKQAVAVLDGGPIEDALKRFQDYIEKELHLEKVRKAITDTDFNALDELLKKKLAGFLEKEKDKLRLEDIEVVRKTVNFLLKKREEYYEKVIEALHRKYSFAFNASFQSTTTSQALLDATFDFSHDPTSVQAFFQQAVRGELDKLFATQPSQVSIATGMLSHGVNRQTHIDVTLPFMDKQSKLTLNEALAKAETIPNGGGLLFTLEASDTVASNQRKGVLSVSMALSKGVRVHQDAIEMNYSMLFAKKEMTVKHLRDNIGPVAAGFFPKKIPNFQAFLDLIDAHTEEKIPNTPNTLGNGLISLEVSLSDETSSSIGQAWLKLPNDRHDIKYQIMSGAIQKSLKSNVHDSVFSNADNYKGGEAPIILAYCALVPRAAKVSNLPGSTPMWDVQDVKERRRMLSDPETLDRMKDLLRRADQVLGDDTFRETDAQRILDRVDPREPLFEALLHAESVVVGHAFEAGLALAKVRNADPSDAVKAFAKFGSKLTEAFNSNVTDLLGPGIRSLGTRIFLDTSRAIDAANASRIAEANAMLNLEFLKPGIQFDAAALIRTGHVKPDQLALADRVVELR